MKALLILLLPLVAAQNIIYFPPQRNAAVKIPDFTVTAGDVLNITWSTTHINVDLTIHAWAPNSNLTDPQFSDTNLPPTGFLPFRLGPVGYLTDKKDAEIQAYFVLAGSRNAASLIRSQNFTIKQASALSWTDGAPATRTDASTWTGSVTLYNSNGVTTTGAPGGAQITPTLSTTTIDSTSGTTATSQPTNTADGTSSTSDSGPDKVGLGVGIGLGVALFLALIGAAFLIIRWRKQSRARAMGAEPKEATGRRASRRASRRTSRGVVSLFRHSRYPPSLPGEEAHQPLSPRSLPPQRSSFQSSIPLRSPLQSSPPALSPHPLSPTPFSPDEHYQPGLSPVEHYHPGNHDHKDTAYTRHDEVKSPTRQQAAPGVHFVGSELDSSPTEHRGGEADSTPISEMTGSDSCAELDAVTTERW